MAAELGVEDLSLYARSMPRRPRPRLNACFPLELELVRFVLKVNKLPTLTFPLPEHPCASSPPHSLSRPFRPFGLQPRGHPPRRHRRQAAQPRLRDRHPQGLDRRGRRLQGPADQGRHRRPAPRRHAEPSTRGSTGSAATRSSATSRPGTLTSVPFKVTHPWASFLVGGGPCAEDVRRDRAAAKDGLLPRVRASRRRTCSRVVVDLAKYTGQGDLHPRRRQAHRRTGGTSTSTTSASTSEKPNFRAPAEGRAAAAADVVQVRRPARRRRPRRR